MDLALVEAARSGDEEAFASIVRGSSDRLFVVAHRILRDVGRAEDAVQQTLVTAWRAFCAGEIVSQASLTEMSTFEPTAHIGSYGLGLYNPANGYAEGFGHTGQLPGYMSWAACLPEDRAVIVVLTNHEVDDGGHFAFSHGLARPLVDALR